MQLTLKNRVNVPQLITDGKSLKYVAVAKTSKFTYQILNIDVSLYLEYVYIPTSNAKSWCLGKKVRKYNIPSGLTSIVSSAFNNCSSLQNITILSGATSIGDNAFNGCTSLQSITIPESVTSIGNNSFGGCNSLYKAKINSSAKIGNYSYKFGRNYLTVFYDFSGVTAVPVLSSSNGIQEKDYVSAIIVPDALYDEWIAATNWVAYASKIKKASEIGTSEVTG